MPQHPISLETLLSEASIPLPPTLPACAVSGLCADSRRVRPGDLFIALSGLHTDARCYIEAARRLGAVAVVAEEDPGQNLIFDSDFPIIRVPNARVAMATLYDAWYGHPGRRLRLLGVTGTNGKTSVSTMIHHILCAAGIPCGLIGTVGCILPSGERYTDPAAPAGMTTPDPAVLYPLLSRMADEAAEGETPVCVMEVTSHALALGKVAPLDFELGVFTNLTPEHLDLHGTMEDYYTAKRRLFEVTRNAVLNADDRYGRRLLSEPLPVQHWYICHAAGAGTPAPDRMCPTGEGGCTRVYAEQVKLLGGDGVNFKLTTPDIRLRLQIPVPGEFSVTNALLASTAALSLGISPATVRDALAAFPGVPGRMERVTLPPSNFPATVYIDFAHTPDALEKLLATAHTVKHRGGRIVLLFGCGGDRDRSKRRHMARVASLMADAVVITSDNSRSEDPNAIIADILLGMDKEREFVVIADRAEAIRYAVRTARAGDIILLAGKGHEAYEITAEGQKPFSERDIVRAAVGHYFGEGHPSSSD